MLKTDHKPSFMELNRVFENNEKWIQEKLNTDANYFDKLGAGQSPDLLFVGCSDSRVTAEELMGLGPGEAFVHRNIANMVISIDLNVMSVITYAVEHLKVKDVVVCGHYGCGGVKAAMQSADLGILNPWLRNIRDVYRIHKLELDDIVDEEKRYERLVELNVKEQCVNLIKTSSVQKAYRDRDLKVHGWVFDVHTGRLVDLKIDFEKYLHDIMEIYHLD